MAHTPLHLATSTEPAHNNQHSAATQSHWTAGHKPTAHIYSITPAAAGQCDGITTAKPVNDAGNISVSLSKSTPHIPVGRSKNRRGRTTQEDYGIGNYYSGQADRVKKVLQVEAMNAEGKKEQVADNGNAARGKDEVPEVASDMMTLVESVEDHLKQEACVANEQGANKPNSCICTHTSHHANVQPAQFAPPQFTGKYNIQLSADLKSRHLPPMNDVTQEIHSPLINPSHPVVAHSTLTSLTALPDQYTNTTTTITYVTSPHPSHHHQCHYLTGTHFSHTPNPTQPLTSCPSFPDPKPVNTSIPLQCTQPKPANLMQYLHYSGHRCGSGVQECGAISPSIRPVPARQHGSSLCSMSSHHCSYTTILPQARRSYSTFKQPTGSET